MNSAPRQAHAETPALTGAVLSLSTRGVAMATNLAFHLLVSRALGVEQSGLVFLSLSMALIMAVPGRLGMDTALIRRGSPLWSAGRLDALAEAWTATLRITVASALLVAAMCWIFAPLLASHVFGQADLGRPLGWFAVAVFPLSVIPLVAATFKLAGRPALASWYEAGAAPVVFMVFALPWMASGESTDAVAFAKLFAASSASAALVGLVAVRRLMPAATTTPEMTGRLVRDGVSLFGIDMGNVLLVLGVFPIIGWLSSPTEVSVFNAAVRLTGPLAVVILVLNNIYSPRLATALAAGRIEEARRLCRAFRRAGLVMVLPPAAVLLSFPAIPRLLFGSAFEAAWPLMPVLCAGHVLATACGPAGLVLIHAGKAGRLQWITAASVLLCLSVTALLIPVVGLQGAALGVASAALLPRLLAVAATRTLWSVDQTGAVHGAVVRS